MTCQILPTVDIIKCLFLGIIVNIKDLLFSSKFTNYFVNFTKFRLKNLFKKVFEITVCG